MREKIERLFERLSDFLFDNAVVCLVVIVAVVASLCTQLPKTRFDISTEGFLRETDRILVDYNEFRDLFGRDQLVVVAVETKNVFDLAFLERLRSLHERIESETPHVEEITSLINIRDTRGEGDSLVVRGLLDPWPETPEDLERIEDRAARNPVYENTIVSEDGTFTAIIVKLQTYSSAGTEGIDVLEVFDELDSETVAPPEEREYLTDAENSAAVKRVARIAEELSTDDFPVYVAGQSPLTHFLKSAMKKDTRRFVAIATVAIVAFLFVMFHRWSGVAIPVLVVGFSLVSIVSAMAALGYAIKMPTQIMPSLIMSVGIGDSVHILAVFFQRLRIDGDKKKAISYAMGHSGLAVVLTTATTAGGFVTFLSSEVAPISDLGIFATLGVLAAMSFSLLMIPPLVAVFPIRAKAFSDAEEKVPATERAMDWVGRFSTSRPVPILLVSLVVIGFAVFGLTRLRFSHFMLEWLPEHSHIRESTEKLDRELKGTCNAELIFHAGKNGFYHPELLKRMDRAAEFFESYRHGDLFVGKAWSATSIVKEAHRALNENRPEYYRIPPDSRAVAQELLLFENSGSDDLWDMVDPQYSKARMTLKVPLVDGLVYHDFLDEAGRYLDREFSDMKVTVTGMSTVLNRTIQNAIRGTQTGYLWAFCIITVLMVLLIGNLKIGLASMIPNLAPIAVTLAYLGYADVPMNLFTMMTGNIAIGLAVDDTIHFMHNFRRYYERSGDPAWAVKQTLHTAGRAMYITSCVLAAGFLLFLFASLNNLFYFGLLSAMIIALALVADYFIAPALMMLLFKKRTLETYVERSETI